jgi:hypothetical protein
MVHQEGYRNEQYNLFQGAIPTITEGNKEDNGTQPRHWYQIKIQTSYFP